MSTQSFQLVPNPTTSRLLSFPSFTDWPSEEQRLLADLDKLRSDALSDIGLSEFVTRWRWIVGEPPAVMLENRSEMIRILVQSMPIASSTLML
ncbi:hypothetical protein MKK68_25985 [Methylobacterium sp. E-016]|nr:hypothetical protein [Methylobacterium sp. E-016]